LITAHGFISWSTFPDLRRVGNVHFLAAHQPVGNAAAGTEVRKGLAQRAGGPGDEHGPAHGGGVGTAPQMLGKIGLFDPAVFPLPPAFSFQYGMGGLPGPGNFGNHD
jgi:hypothetical protein